jgi:hypothetical protein
LNCIGRNSRERKLCLPHSYCKLLFLIKKIFGQRLIYSERVCQFKIFIKNGERFA